MSWLLLAALLSLFACPGAMRPRLPALAAGTEVVVPVRVLGGGPLQSGELYVCQPEPDGRLPCVEYGYFERNMR